jgi:hypothetical protein
MALLQKTKLCFFLVLLVVGCHQGPTASKQEVRPVDSTQPDTGANLAPKNDNKIIEPPCPSGMECRSVTQGAELGPGEKPPECQCVPTSNCPPSAPNSVCSSDINGKLFCSCSSSMPP